MVNFIVSKLCIYKNNQCVLWVKVWPDPPPLNDPRENLSLPPSSPSLWRGCSLSLPLHAMPAGHQPGSEYPTVSLQWGHPHPGIRACPASAGKLSSHSTRVAFTSKP